MSIEHVATIVAAFAGPAAIFQAIFAGFLLRYIKKQTRIIDRQTEIMGTQNEVVQEIDKSNKATVMLTRYADLSRKRDAFWTSLRHLYLPSFKDYINRQSLPTSVPTPESVYSFIQGEVFPPDFCPEAEKNLLEFIKNHEDAWESQHVMIWEFAKFAHDIFQDNRLSSSGRNIDHEQFKQLREAQHDLAYFWEMWSRVLDVREYLQPDPKELLMLTWLEFALVKQTEDYGRPGKTGLFKLAKDECESLRS